ncbi:MAG: PolC-type DNA polymerase III [Bacilli bacterium]|nr:PolC-type DNA polymerase III [Bacilli bacterium]
MQDKLKKLFEEINVEDSVLTYFDNSSIEKVVLYDQNKIIEFLINTENLIPIDIYNQVLDKLTNIFNTFEIVKLVIIPNNIDYSKLKEYYLSIMNEICIDRFKYQIFLDRDIDVDNNIITIKAYNKVECTDLIKLKQELIDKLFNYGFKVEINIDLVLEGDKELIDKIEHEKEISETVTNNNQSNPTPKKEIEEPKKTPYRAKKSNEITEIKDVLYEVENINIKGTIFGIDYFESKSGYKIITLKVTDYTDSMYVKMFTKDDEEYSLIKKLLKEGKWYIFYGKAVMDKYANEIVFNTRYKDVEETEAPPKEKIVDDEPVKRVELHAHTMMSQMDGITKVDLGKHTCELVTRAMDMGYKGVAITDHNGCQAFPIAFGIISSYNKGKEEKDKFKGLYGTELTLVDDTVNIVVRPTETPLEGTTYVVFDTETTGFNAGGEDQMIEIGAVKICNDEIIDRFDELIDPKRPLPQKITELTCITDEMLKGKPDEETVTKKFLEWAGDLPMVAHNAKFDISFIEMSMKKYNLGEFKNTVIDTLELSRTLDQGFARHGLSALVKRYNVPWEEDAHHRADYDAEGTAHVFAKMLQKLTAQNYKLITDLDKLVSKEEIHKFGRTYHFNAIAKNKTGLKNLFKIISLANTTYLYKTPRILRSKLNELREGLLIGSGCYESEVFIESRSKEGQELTNIINFYDYVEVQPPEVYDHLIQTSDFKNKEELKHHIEKIVNATKEAGKIIVATGDVHHFEKEDKIYREIIVNQKVPGGGRHPLAKNNITNIPSQHYRTTREMLNDFSFLPDDLAYEIVVTNTNKVLDMVEELEVIIDTGGIPFSPRVKSDDGSHYLDCPSVVTDLVYTKAASWYGENLPYNIEERIAKELYGDIVYKCWKEKLKEENPDISEEELEKLIFTNLHKTVLEGFDSVKTLIREYVTKNWKEEDGELDEKSLEKRVKKELGGIIGGGFDPIYLISQRLVKHSNDDGYLVGSRGSVGSSFVATMMGITEVNPLPAHYRCTKCRNSIFIDDDGKELGATYSSGFDLPDKNCPKCGERMYKDGQDMPFATFLGFNADKVPDIDLNFSDLNQASAHEYTKVLFGVDNVYRAGTIGTVAEKTAFGFVKGYYEDRGITNKRTCEIERLAKGCTGVKRTTGQHPGGIVVVPDYMEVSDFTPFQFPADDANSAWRTTHFDYHAIDQDLLKLDILGHSDPTQLRMIQDLTGTDILKVPLDDKETMSIFTSTKALGVTEEQIMCKTGTLGIPEFGTPFTIGMVEETKPTTFAELIKISGLSHGTDVWLGNAQELIKNNIVPFKEVIGCRDDIMVYLMYHGVEPIKAFKIMEFVRKGKASKEPDAWKGHVETMEKAGIEKWYIDSCAKIKYMFPKAHAAAYVISAFRIAWYKVHMPAYYYASWFSTKATDFNVEAMIKGYDAIKEVLIEIENKGYDATNKEQGVAECLKLALEASARGIKIANIDLYKSRGLLFDVEDEKTIIPPFSSIDGLGDVVAKNIEAEAKKHPFISIEDFQNRCKVSSTLIDKMKSMGIFENMPETSQLTLF